MDTRGLIFLGLLGTFVVSKSPRLRGGLSDLLDELAKAAEEEKRRKALLEIIASHPLPPPPPQIVIPALAEPPEETPIQPVTLTPTDAALARMVNHPSVILILGHRGSGKSALALRLQELLRDIAPAYGVGLPTQGSRLLPAWYGLSDDPSTIPPGAIIYIPESYRLFHARNSQSAQGRSVGDLINLSRQRRHTLIFDLQNSAHLDRNIVSEADLILVKEPGPFQKGFERSELKSVMDGARAAFAGVGTSRKKRAVWVATAAGAGQGQIMENLLPTFWSNSVSTMFGMASAPSDKRTGSKTTAPRRGQGTPVEAKRQKCKEMKTAGHSYNEIAKTLGISKSYAFKLVNDSE